MTAAAMQTVIVDTDVAMDYLRGAGYARDLMLGLWDGNAAYLSILSVCELYRQKGLTLTSIDCLVNATAVIKSHKIATRNKDRYPDKRILFAMDNVS